jgi:hypothetical protein
MRTCMHVQVSFCSRNFTDQMHVCVSVYVHTYEFCLQIYEVCVPVFESVHVYESKLGDQMTLIRSLFAFIRVHIHHVYIHTNQCRDIACYHKYLLVIAFAF